MTREIDGGGAGHDHVVVGGAPFDEQFAAVQFQGRDTVGEVATRGGDLMIAGTTSFDNSQTSLAAIMKEWTANLAFDQRVKDLTGVSSPKFAKRLNGNVFLVSSTVQNDDAPNVAVGGKGLAWKRYDSRPGTTYLIRPDRYVAARWRAHDPAAVSAALARATARSHA